MLSAAMDSISPINTGDNTMPINHESLIEQITQITNQLGHIKKQLQQEIVKSNDPQAALRDENARLQAELEQRRIEQENMRTVMQSQALLMQKQQQDADTVTQDQESDTPVVDKLPDAPVPPKASAQQPQTGVKK